VVSRGATRQTPAGWHPDPLGPPGQLRWWDGSRWTAAVQTPSAPDRARALGPASTPKRARRTIGWAALGGFVLAVSGVVMAITRGQDVCEVSATGVKFCESDEPSQVEQGQAQIDQQVSQFEEQASQLDANVDDPNAADLAGTWTSEAGFTYVIEQWGAEAVITEIGPGNLTSAVGMGTIDGNAFSFDFQAADGSFGVGELTIDGDTLTGGFFNSTIGLSVPVVLHQ
jgi:hypothetical protein